MHSFSSHKQKLDYILANSSFDELEEYSQDHTWHPLNGGERHLLAMLFVMRGDRMLAKGDLQAIECLEIATKICPNDSKVFYEKGLAFLTASENIGCLQSAVKAFENAVLNEPQFFEAWCVLAESLCRLGEFFQEERYFQQANETFVKAFLCSKKVSDSALGKVYWTWGSTYASLGRFHGEALDYHLALEKYAAAAQLGVNTAVFWKDYGSATCELANLVNRIDLLLEAEERYQNALACDPDHYDSLLALALYFQRLFEVHNQDDDFRQSYYAFERAASLEKEDPKLWLKWGQLLFHIGRMNINEDALSASFEKFEKAIVLDPYNSIILTSWGESLMVYGVYMENVDMLRSAELKLIRSLEIEPEAAEVWHIYGNCLNEMGRYFSDEQYYRRALEKFQRGLSIAPEDPLLWHGISLAYFSIGESSQDPVMMENSLEFCKKSIEMGGDIFPQYWNDWGVALMKLAELTNQQHLVEEAVTKFEQAIQVHGENFEGLDPEWLYNYGCALDFLGDFHDDSVFYEKAIQVLSKVLELDTAYTHARYNLALAYSHLGELASDVDCFHKAIEQYQLLLTNDPEDEMGWNEYGLTLLNLARLLNDPSLPHLSKGCYEQAESKLLHALSLGSVNAHYNLACLYSLTGNYPLSMHFIEKAEAAGALPQLEDIMQDEWLEGVRSTAGFSAFVAHIAQKQKDKR
jgi:tetratricopeptide (TPR) repeat protein